VPYQLSLLFDLWYHITLYQLLHNLKSTYVFLFNVGSLILSLVCFLYPFQLTKTPSQQVCIHEKSTSTYPISIKYKILVG